MKGIRKLFLGLFLVALFGAGFKIDAKAAITAKTYAVNVPAGVDYYASGDTNPVTGTLTVTFENLADITPTVGNYVTYKVQLQSGDNAVGETKYFCLKESSGVVYKKESTVSAADAATGTGTAITSADPIACTVTALRSQIKDARGSEATTEYGLKLHVTKETSSTSATPDLEGSTATAVTLTKQITTTVSPAVTGVSITPENPYLLPGQRKKFVLTIASSSLPLSKKFDAPWVVNNDTTLVTGEASISLPEIYQYVTLKPGVTTGTTEVKANFVDGGLTVTWPAGTVSPGTTISPSFQFTGGYSSNDIYDNGIYVDSVAAGNKLTYTLTNLSGDYKTGNIQFTVPGLGNGTHKLFFQMKDGNVLQSSTFTVNDTTTLSWKSTSALSDGVAVTYGKDIFLYHFLSTGSLKSGTASLGSSSASEYASITASSDGIIGNGKLNGTKAMTGDSGKKDKITLTPTTGTALEGKVTVYPQISIATNSSGSSDDSLNSGSSSTTSKDTPLKVTSPTYVYYGDTDYQVKKVQLRIAGPAGTEKKTLDAPSSDSTSSLSWSASVDSIKLSKILKEVCDSSSNTLTITVKPYNGDNVDDNMAKSVEVKAYKINLDGGGGAKYTVNGEDMGDYFYAVKGTRYTIKAQPKVSGDKFLNWDGSVFSSESGGDFTASESRTFRANYSSSSSSSNTNKNAINGESMSGDYDDVPKTGESKTDIWILWSVLFISILGAGFMIWKRFGLARAIAEADAAVEHAEYEEQVRAAEKEKKEKLDMLKDLRNL